MDVYNQQAKGEIADRNYQVSSKSVIFAPKLNCNNPTVKLPIIVINTHTHIHNHSSS